MEVIEENYYENDIKLANINSLLLDNGEIASIKFSDGSYCCLAVRGDKSVFYKGEEYRYASDYPKELVELIKTTSPDDFKEDDENRWYFWDNNWVDFEYMNSDGDWLTDDIGYDPVDGEFGDTIQEVRDFMIKYKESFD